jgi:hypothetical protein
MATIYLVTSGEYSDYHVVAAFETRELAEEAARLFQVRDRWSDSVNVEEYPILTDASMRDDLVSFREYLSYHHRSHHEGAEPAFSGLEDQSEVVTQEHGRYGYVTVRSMTPERAQKIAQDRAAEEKARLAWLT